MNRQDYNSQRNYNKNYLVGTEEYTHKCRIAIYFVVIANHLHTTPLTHTVIYTSSNNCTNCNSFNSISNTQEFGVNKHQGITNPHNL